MTAGLIPAVILTRLYIENQAWKTDGTITGMFWSWETFGLGAIAGIISIISLIYKGVYYFNLKKKRKLSLNIQGNYLFLTYKF